MDSQYWRASQMKIGFPNGQTAYIRPYQEGDFQQIQDLNAEEGWTNLVKENANMKVAWEHSTVAYIIETEGGAVVGYIRGLTDTRITLYICELLISNEYRGLGLGKKLLQYVHQLYPNTRMEMLASSTSHSFYEVQGYRAFYGFRKTIGE
jgi:ribosomal protein S18 acetylase RimI-like enzyme